MPGQRKMIPTVHQEFWLTAWLVSMQQSFQTEGLSDLVSRYVPYFWHLVGGKPTRVTGQLGRCGVAGVVQGKLNAPLLAIMEFLAHYNSSKEKAIAHLVWPFNQPLCRLMVYLLDQEYMYY